MMTETDEQQDAEHEFIIASNSDDRDCNTSGMFNTRIGLWIQSDLIQTVLILHLLGREMRRPS